VVCAFLFPISIVIWSQRADHYTRIVACCLGIVVAFLPIALQIITWQFIHYSTGDIAVVIVSAFAAASLSISVTTLFLRAETEVPRSAILPYHIRKGFLRLYVILLIPWMAWFGYAAHRANFDGVDISRRAATYVDRILRGAKPGDLPVQFPTKLVMVVNRNTATALGLAHRYCCASGRQASA
jgi:hypothetical protein